jgi:nucleoside-diphosphate-sugar epimerase
MNHLLGKEGTGMMTASVHIDDVAKCHVKSLDPSIPAGRYLLASDTTYWEEAIPVVKKFFPEAVGKTFVENAEVKALIMVCGNEKAEKTFGIQFKSFEEQVKSAVGYYLSLLSK